MRAEPTPAEYDSDIQAIYRKDGAFKCQLDMRAVLREAGCLQPGDECCIEKMVERCLAAYFIDVLPGDAARFAALDAALRKALGAAGLDGFDDFVLADVRILSANAVPWVHNDRECERHEPSLPTPCERPRDRPSWAARAGR